MVTGHRIERLAAHGADREQLERFATIQILEHVKKGPIFTGMALGWDQAIASAAMRLGVPYIAVLPCVNQHIPWASDTIWQRYFELLSRAKQVIYVSNKPYEGPSQMHRRNEWMVDQATHVLALWDGVDKGGTASCIRYAREGGKVITNRWVEWQRFRKAA